MKDVTAFFTILLGTLAATVANAQTATSRVQQTRASQAVRQVQPAPAVASPAIRPSTSVTQTSPYGTAGKQAIPGNLFSIEDRAIIIVGGKQVAAGDVKRRLVSDLRQISQPVSTARTVSRMNSQPVRDNPRSALGGINGSLLRPKPRSPQDRITADGGVAGASIAGRGRETLANKPALSYSELMNYCKTHPIEITRVRGTITPGSRFTIEGICFGEQTGAVEVIGQFPGGNMRLVFDSWSDYEIRAFVPPVSGAADHTIALTVVRFPDKVRSPNVQAQFIAARQIVPVPANYWTPTADFLQIDIDQGGGNIFGGYTVFGTGPAQARLAPFSLHVNPACGLDTAGANVRSGAVLAINGWEDGPPYQANVNVAWTPRCVIQTTNYVLASSSQRICDIDFTLSAQASCPVGVAP
jgi:hypothetical protein